MSTVHRNASASTWTLEDAYAIWEHTNPLWQCQRSMTMWHIRGLIAREEFLAVNQWAREIERRQGRMPGSMLSVEVQPTPRPQP